MEDLTLRYLDAEMRYLREAAKEFAAAHPDRAAEIGLMTPGSADASVERLFQGFSFSMGRLREKLDDDLPELTEGLVSMLWPHYLRTIPSLSIVELAPAWQEMKMTQTLGAHFEVISQPVGTEGPRCRYRTTRDLPLQPLTLSHASLAMEPDGQHIIRLRFSCSLLANWQWVDLSCLSVYLNGDAPLACALLLALTHQVRKCYLRLPGQVDRQPVTLHFKAEGLGELANLWERGDAACCGYQQLLEYFTFREKFMFVALCGLERVVLPATLAGFEVDIVLDSPFPSDFSFDASHLRLHCVPVINLFSLDAKPLSICNQETDYLLQPLRQQAACTEIYSVDSVTSSRRTHAQVYTPFRTFRYHGGTLHRHLPARYYHTRVKPGVTGLHETWLILGGDGFEQERQIAEETLTLSLTGTNGQLPRLALRSTVLNATTQALPVPLNIHNLCPPTMPAYPPNRDRFHWRVLSHLGTHFLSMMDNAEVLRNTLALYDWTESEDNRRRLDAIVKVEHFRLQRFEKGLLLRGVDIEVTVESPGFYGEGDIYLFGEVLNRFLALYADIHLFNRLTLIVQPSGKCLQWKENHSQYIPG
ncbi:type VI secretion system baseplate subunit TssF [Rahnella sp. SL6]|uniref:type VI secretion system baseplate subunit TssF n=1 Tax=Rahnella perminowiae TaxID=2816244 RepID=UPI001C25E376|nr:type VI secretion system baseplate subunit TssF [Rahnella perminowiae]MBU9809552.1 type VI secretion system baseplate subunit TssF [Rahnella perminowiae]